jgi:hypothetical protein
MKQEIVLPKLRVPGQANWLLRGLWIGVVLVSVWVVVLGIQIMRRPEAPAPVAALPPGAPAAPAAPVAPKTAAPAPKPGLPGAPASTAAKPGGARPVAGKFAGSRHRGGRALRGRGTWGKAHGKGYRSGGRRALAARKAYLRKKRWHAARAAGRLGGATAAPAGRAAARAPAGRAPAANDLSFPGSNKRAVKPAAKSAKGDPIDDILRNFK